MKSSTISGSNGMMPVSNSILLTPREWIITLILVALVSVPVYFGWFEWERFAPGKDYRVTCWAERESDYWAFARWSRYARDKFEILLVGDSVIWGQETTSGETISHYLNEGLGGEMIANIGIDGLHMAGIHGMVKHYGRSLKGKNIILQLNPLWISSEKRDLRGEGRISYHHPRLLPQPQGSRLCHSEFALPQGADRRQRRSHSREDRRRTRPRYRRHHPRSADPDHGRRCAQRRYRYFRRSV